jgi:hypothetical protein
METMDSIFNCYYFFSPGNAQPEIPLGFGWNCKVCLTIAPHTNSISNLRVASIHKPLQIKHL